jgi:hypothetical protein
MPKSCEDNHEKDKLTQQKDTQILGEMLAKIENLASSEACHEH